MLRRHRRITSYSNVPKEQTTSRLRGAGESPATRLTAKHGPKGMQGDPRIPLSSKGVAMHGQHLGLVYKQNTNRTQSKENRIFTKHKKMQDSKRKTRERSLGTSGLGHPYSPKEGEPLRGFATLKSFIRYLSIFGNMI
ncbi:hypothetical protein AVEN_156675-1 [Araneus ventricosus]|uniref:Uncharacterized protein n=1 Tax=Araneus ventricosus TaxID=182803 RepID=A0A4Y2QMS0_ARAVE|nr:hypothetical protein AVEN_156675-1 [Araneus ventricosus]